MNWIWCYVFFIIFIYITYVVSTIPGFFEPCLEVVKRLLDEF